MDAAARAAGIADVADPSVNPSRDVEPGTHHPYRNSLNHSRASLPTSRNRTYSISTTASRAQSLLRQRQRQQQYPGSTFTSADPTYDNNEYSGDQEDAGDELAWGPSHPCFPHLNPHVPISSDLYDSTRVIRIQRDWLVAGELAPTFSQLYPEILEPVLSENAFRRLVAHVNEELLRIYDPWRTRAWIDTGLGLATGWLWDDFGMTGVKKELAKLDRWVEEFSQNVAQPKGSRIIPLRKTAYTCLDIEIPDPQVTVEYGEGAEEPMSPGEAEDTNGTMSASQSANGDRPKPVLPPIPDKFLRDSMASSVQ